MAFACLVLMPPQGATEPKTFLQPEDLKAEGERKIKRGSQKLLGLFCTVW